MIDIILTILIFNVMIMVLKSFSKFKIDNLQALIVNYLLAGILGIFLSDEKFSINYILSAPWIYHAIIIGILFIVVFNFYAKGTQKIGIAVTTVANKLSLLIPVAVAIILYPGESFSIIKGVGFVLAILGIYLASTEKGKLSFDKKYLWLIILVFVGQGLADSIFNNAQQTVVNENDKGLFLMTLLLIAAIGGTIMLIGKSIKEKPQLKVRNLIGGIALGIPNFASLVFFFNALESSGLESSQVFPVISMGIVVVSAFVGYLFFKEKLALTNWIGLAFAIAAIFVITFL